VTREGQKSFFNEKNYDWMGAMQGVLRWLDMTYQYMLAPHYEDLKIKLFKVDVGDSEKGLEAAKNKEWGKAYQYFVSARELQAKTEPDDYKTLARLCCNAGAALMETGDLEGARKLLSQSQSYKSSSEAEDLMKEIDRRLADRIKM